MKKIIFNGLILLLLLPLSVFAISSNTGSYMTSGFTWNFTVSESSFLPSPPTINLVSNLLDANINTYTNTFFLNFSSVNDSYIEFRDNRDNSLLCNTSMSSSNFQSCVYSFDDNDIRTSYYIKTTVCNFYGCSVNYDYLYDVTNFMFGDGIQVRNGFKLTSFTSKIIIYPPSYISPTPINNLKKSNLENFTINITDGGSSLSSCSINIDGVNSSLTYSNHYCYGTFATNLNNTPKIITFQANYVLTGVTYYLDSRTIVVYPNQSTENKVPAYGLLSLFLTLLLLSINFIIYGVVKK